jgi:hypothetical protein
VEGTVVFSFKIVLQQLPEWNKGNVQLKEYEELLE